MKNLIIVIIIANSLLTSNLLNAQIATEILENEFRLFKMNDRSTFRGEVVKMTADEIILKDYFGKETTLKMAQVKYTRQINKLKNPLKKERRKKFFRRTAVVVGTILTLGIFRSANASSGGSYRFNFGQL